MNWLKRILCGLGFTKKSGCPMEWSSASGAASLCLTKTTISTEVRDRKRNEG
jgi:hypothetical protein